MGGIPGYDARNNDARTPLHRAAAAGKAKAVIEILGGLDRAGFGNFKNAQDKAGQTALHLAAENNFVEVADILLKANGSPANPHLKDNNGQTPLHLAAEKGHEAMIRLLLGSDSSPKTPDKDGRIPLHLAAYNGHERAVVALLSREDVYKTKNIRDSQGQPAIYYAVDRLHKSVAARLKGALADVEAPAAGNQTLLHQMVSTNRADAADILLGLGADMEFRDAQGRTPLYAAAEKGHRRAFDVLYEKWHANKNATESLTGRTLMHRAAAERNPHATQLLLEAKASTEERDLEGQTPLYVAAKVGDVNIARLLVAGGAAKDAQGGGESGTLLHRAAREGDARAVGVLCDVDADKEARDAKGRSPLYVAAESNQRAAVVRLVEKGADREARDPAQSNETLLHRAAREGHAAATELLIAVGAGRNAVDAEGRAPLHVAALHALDVVEKLLDAEADVDKRDAAGRTPLHVAAGRGDDALDMVKKLLSYDADPVLPDHGGRTPLHAAADTGQVNVAIELLQHPDVRANRNRADAQGRTALHVAAARDGVDIEHLLINDGLDIEARDAEGRTPLHIAAQLGRRAAVFRLLALGADRSAKDHGGNYPIMLAAECGDPELIRMLADPTEFKVPLPETMREYVVFVHKFVRDNLHGVFDPNDERVKRLAEEAYKHVPRVCETWSLPRRDGPGLVTLMLYDIVVLCDDSASMRTHPERIRGLRDTLWRVTQIALSMDIDQSGIYVRFLNFDRDDRGDFDNMRNANDVLRRVDNVYEQELTGSQLGTKLLQKVVEPLVKEKLARADKRDKKPLLVVLITDGEPTKEPKDTLKKTIINCRRALDRLNISKAAVIFLLSQVGNEPEATRFLRGIEQDREISDMVYCSDQRLEDLQRTVANTQSDHGYTVKLIQLFLAAVGKQAV